MRTISTQLIAIALAISWLAASSVAVTVPYTEDFTSSSANWVNFNSGAFLTHSATGGPDGGGYASGTFSFFNRTAGSSPVVLRARHDFDASGDAFVGDWVTSGVRFVTAQVRHNAPVPLDFFMRDASTINFPGAFSAALAPVLPNQWTELIFAIRSNSPQFESFEGSDFTAIFSNIGHVQFGVTVPAALVTDAASYTFSIDKVTIRTPEPASIVSAGIALGFIVFVPGCRRARRNRPSA